jgi:hypothetical protein
VTEVVHFSFLITHEVVRELIVPGIVISFLNTLLLADWR